MDSVRMPCVCFEAGDYRPYGRSLYTEQDLGTIAARTNAYGLQAVNLDEPPIPLTVEHGDTEDVLNLGNAVVGSFRVKGNQLLADLEIPKPALELIKSRHLSVEINPQDKVISKITITSNPVVANAMFAIEGERKDVECFSFSIQGDEPMDENVTTEVVEDETLAPEDTQEETAPETPIEAIERVVTELVVEAAEELIESALNPTDVATEEMKCDEEEKPKEEMADPKDEAIAALQARVAALEDEKWAQAVEAYSHKLVATGIPPAVATLLAPWGAMEEGTEKFSKNAEFVKTARGLIEFFSDPKAFTPKLGHIEDTDALRTSEKFSDDVVIRKVQAECEKQGIELYSNEYKKMLAAEAFRTN